MSVRVAWWGERWCLLVDRTGITEMVEGLVGAVGGGCACCAAKGCPGFVAM